MCAPDDIRQKWTLRATIELPRNGRREPAFNAGLIDEGCQNTGGNRTQTDSVHTRIETERAGRRVWLCPNSIRTQ